MIETLGIVLAGIIWFYGMVTWRQWRDVEQKHDEDFAWNLKLIELAAEEKRIEEGK